MGFSAKAAPLQVPEGYKYPNDAYLGAYLQYTATLEEIECSLGKHIPYVTHILSTS